MVCTKARKNMIIFTHAFALLLKIADIISGSLSFMMLAQDMDARPKKPSTDDLIQTLEDVRLGYILSRFGLDSTHEWSSVLSIGEQQRLAFARLLLSKPNLALLDESTSALDEANEVIKIPFWAFNSFYLRIHVNNTLNYF